MIERSLVSSNGLSAQLYQRLNWLSVAGSFVIISPYLFYYTYIRIYLLSHLAEFYLTTQTSITVSLNEVRILTLETVFLTLKYTLYISPLTLRKYGQLFHNRIF